METNLQVSYLACPVRYGTLTILSFFQHRSESPSQVFAIVIQWLMTLLENVPQQNWSEVIVSYDNMCHLDSMRVAQNPLPLPEPYDKLWLSVTKVQHVSLRLH